MAEATGIRLQWSQHDKRYYDTYINAELRMRIGGVQTEMTYKRYVATPPDMLEIVEDAERSQEKVKVFRCSPSEQLLKSPDFFEKIKQPVEVQIIVAPSAEAALGAVTDSPPEIMSTCSIEIEPPVPVLHWRDTETGAEDTVLEIDADGEDELNLEVWVERFVPGKGVFERDDTAHFTHKTDATMKAAAFGPRDNDKPWEVAKPGSGNRRQMSAWISKCALPSSKHPEYTLPHDGNLHLKAWAENAITARMVNEIVHAPGTKPLIEGDIIIRLVPVNRWAYLVDPRVPIAADGNPVELELEIRRVSDNRPVKHAEISLELRDAGGPPGGTIDPLTKILEPADNGRVRVTFTPPELSYRRGTTYKNELVVSEGPAAAKKELSVIPLHLNPKLEATIKAEKKELEFEGGSITMDVGTVPESLKGVLAMDVVNGAPQIKRTYEVAHAKVWLESKQDAGDALGDGSGLSADSQTAQAVTDGDSSAAHPGEVRTDGKGVWELKLPELHEGWDFAQQSPKTYELTKDENPITKFGPHARETIDRYDESKVHTRWYLFEGQLNDSLRTHRLTYAAQLCRNPELDAPRILSGAELLRTGMVFSAGYERMHEQQWAQATNNLGLLHGEIIGLAINMFSWGDKMGKALNWVARNVTWAASAPFRLLRWITGGFMDFMSWIGRKAATWGAKQSLSPSGQRFIEGLAATADGLYQMASSIVGKSFVDFMAGLANLIMGALRFLRGFIWGGVMLGVKIMAGGLGYLAEAAGFLSGERLARWHTNFETWATRTWANATMDEASMGTWGIGKHCEWLTGQALNWADVTGSSSDFLVQSLRDKHVMTAAATTHMSAVWDDVFHLNVPEEPHTNRATFIDGTSTLAAELQALELRDIQVDLYMDWAETGLLCVEMLLAAGVILAALPAALGLGAAGAAGAGAAGAAGAGAAGATGLTSFFVAETAGAMSVATKVEVGASAIRSAIRLPQTAIAMNNASYVLATYGQRTEGLTLGAAAP